MGRIEEQVKNAFNKFKENSNLYEFVRKLIVDADYSVRFAWQLSEVLDAIKKYCPQTLFECVFYDGENGVYHLLDFDPNGLSDKQLKEKIRNSLQHQCHIDPSDVDRFMDSVYLINTNIMVKVGN